MKFSEKSYQAFTRSWRQLRAVPLPLPEAEIHQLVELLDQLVRLDGQLLIQLWQDVLEAPARIITLLDLDGDQQLELLLVSNDGSITCYRPEAENTAWRVTATGQLPFHSGPIIGVEATHTPSSRVQVPHIVTGVPGNTDRFYEILMTTSGKLEVRELPPDRSGHRRLAIGNRFGDLQTIHDLAYVWVGISRENKKTLWGQSYRQTTGQTSLNFQPTAVVHTGQRVLVGDNQERLHCWQWHQGEFQSDPSWPATGRSIRGRVTALALWPHTDERWLILAATDERWLIVLDEKGEIQAEIALPQVATAIIPWAEKKLLWVAFVDNCLSLLRPIAPPFLNQPWPTVAEMLDCLPAASRQALLDQWRQSNEPTLARALLAGLATHLQNGDEQTLKLLSRLGHTNSGDCLPAASIGIIDSLEPLILAQEEADMPLIKASLAWAWSLYLHCPLALRRRLDIFTGRLSAQFDSLRNNPDYQQLNQARQQGDRRLARQYLKEAGQHETGAGGLTVDRLRSAFTLYAEMLVQRRQTTWVFAAEESIRTILTLPETPHTLITTRDGQRFQLDLVKKSCRITRPSYQNDVPCGMVLGPGDEKGSTAVALLTVQGHLYMASARKDDCLAEMQLVHQVESDAWGLALIAPAPGALPRLIVSCDGGRLIYHDYDPQNGRWPKVKEIVLEAEWLHSLVTGPLVTGQPPVILAGGAQTGGGGILHLLDLEGHPCYQRHLFPGPVLDVRLVTMPGSDERAIAVACADGYLYLMRPNGLRLWRYQVGRAARSLAVFDIDDDGEEEIIVGGEAEENMVLILDLQGAIQWHIPTRAPVTHVVATRLADNRPRLLIVDLERILQVVEVNPPDSAEEKAIKQEAADCLAVMAARQGVSTEALVKRWLIEAPNPIWRCYAFYAVADAALNGHPEALTWLLAVEVAESQPVIQRAYGRALVNVATLAHNQLEAAQQARERLRHLLATPASQRGVGLAAICKLALPGRLVGHSLSEWLSVLETAVANPLAEVRRAALYAARRLLISVDPAIEWPPEWPPAVWNLLHLALDSRSDNDVWLEGEIACLARGMTGDLASLWETASRHLANLKQGTILGVLGQTTFPLLDSPATAEVMNRLAQLRQAESIEKMGMALQALVEALTHSNFQELVADYRFVELFQIIVQAVTLANKEAWQHFVSGRSAAYDGFGRLITLLTSEEREFSQDHLATQLKQVRQIEYLIHTFCSQPSDADSLRRLIKQLEQRGEGLASLVETGGTVVRQADNLILTQAMAGLLWLWSRPEGILGQWLAEMNRPAEPCMELLTAELRRDELLLEIALWNPGQSQTIEDIRLRFQQACLICNREELTCHADPGTQVRDLVLEPQARLTFRLHAFFSNDQQRALIDTAVQQDQTLRLELPVGYYQLAKGWASETLTITFQVEHTPRLDLDWERDLPYAWRTRQNYLRQAIQSHAPRPLLIECTPLAREKLLKVLSGFITGGPQPPVVDVRQWFYTFRHLEQPDEAHLLAWLAERCWPQATRQAAAIRLEGAPHYHFRELARTQPHYQAIILTNWERLLVSAGRRSRWLALDYALPFLHDWARSEGTQLIFIGTYLAEQVTRQRWPHIAEQFQVVRCDHIGISDAKAEVELTAALEHLLKARQLISTLNRFSRPASVTDIIRASGGYLHILEFVAVRGLTTLHQDTSSRPESVEQYLIQYADQANVFHTLWLWQDFFERLAVVLASQGEIPVQQRAWVEEGLILAQDYYARQPDGRQATRPTLTAGVRLGKREVTSIKSNIHYQSGDAVIRGFNPQRQLRAEWGATGSLFLQLLQAGGGHQLLDHLVESKVLLRRTTRYLGNFYEVAVPIYAGWLERTGVWDHMRAAAQTGLGTWYPEKLAQDQRPEAGGEGRLLFQQRQAGTAHQDVPFSTLPAIEKALNKYTKPLFLNLYGLIRLGPVDGHKRWQALVNLASALQDWGHAPSTAGGEGEILRRLFEALGTLLHFRPVQEHFPGGDWIRQAPISNRSDHRLPWAYVELNGGSPVLRKELLLLVIRDTNLAERDTSDLQDWAKIQLQDLYPTESEEERRDRLERSVVLAIVLNAAASLKQNLPADGAGPHFVFLEIANLLDVIVHPNPVRALMSKAFDAIGRRSFAPYKLVGSLTGSSPLFVGRESELNTILNSLEREDHAILGSRRIGKTSLLQRIEYQLRQSAPQAPVFLIRLTSPYTAGDFYKDFKYALQEADHHRLADQLASEPGQDYSDLRHVMAQLAQTYQRPVVLLMDEIDGLYLWDKKANQERLFQFWRNNLAQSTPRLCTFVMTGYRHIYLSRLDHSSVFYNFCRFHNLAGVDREGVRRLVMLLKGLEIELKDENEVVGLIEHDTYAIPYFVQLVCDRLLRQVDRFDLHQVGPDDARRVLEQDVRKLLRQELWDELSAEISPIPTPEHRGKRKQILKTKILLLATIITLYQEKFELEFARVRRPQGSVRFTAVEALKHLRELYANAWEASEDEVKQLLDSLSMTLALSPVEEDRHAYYFPNDILPDVLFFYQREGELDLINELDKMVAELQRL